MNNTFPTEGNLSGLSRKDFQKDINDKKTDLFILKNTKGMEVAVTNYGCAILSIMVPDKNGKYANVILGHDSIDHVINSPEPFLSTTIGRYGNRIAKGKFTLFGEEHELTINNGPNSLHGGPTGFHARVWDAIQLDESTVQFNYVSADGEEGFPGNLACKVTFTLTDDNAIDICYNAETDHTSVVNLTNHSYFNLNGNPATGNSDHLLTIYADAYTPVDSTFMTTGEIASVGNTDMDFRQPTPIGARIDNEFIQLKYGKGYDHNWVLNTKGDVSQVCATLESPQTGIVLDIYTNEPGLQFYAGNFLDGTVKGKKGIVYNRRASVCLETQKYPDSPNKPEWPSALLKPGEKYESRCIYKFSVRK